jgi:16S rRNA (guanine527-N7)-methyltransferase
MQNNKDAFFAALEEYTNSGLQLGNILLNFCKLIQKSNKLYNLTSIIQTEEMLSKHILDSLSINYLIKGKNVLDIGSGAGLPGIPLAVINPDINFLLLDSNNKKIIFLNHVKINLNIKNIDLVHARIEDFNNDVRFDTIICRSYASLSKIYLNSKKHLKDRGIIIAMKGKEPYQELKELREISKNICVDVKSLNVPGLVAERHAIIIYKK